MTIESDIKSIAASLDSIADLLARNIAPLTEPTKVAPDRPATAQRSVEPNPTNAAVRGVQPPVWTLETVNQALTEVVQQLGGKAAPVLELLNTQFGAASLREVKPEQLNAVVVAARGLVQ